MISRAERLGHGGRGAGDGLIAKRWSLARPEPELRIKLECDITDGPLVRHMSRYTAEEFNTFVVHRGSDSNRRAIAYENSDLVEFVKNAYAGTGTTIERKIFGVDDIVKDLQGSMSHDGSF